MKEHRTSILPPPKEELDLTPAQEIARILRERVIPRARLIDEIVVEKRSEEIEPGVFRPNTDMTVGSIVYDIIELCDGLANSLDGGTLPSRYESELRAAKLTGEVLRRVADNGNDLHSDLAEFLAKELTGEWEATS